ncbi:MAG: tetratricopeptide repeat protein, partial [Acidobacteriia bacterium]|nr:tetratricopeptide repeat protein [Terriglobia bacterium]
MLCPRCGESNEETASTCSACGSALARGGDAAALSAAGSGSPGLPGRGRADVSRTSAPTEAGSGEGLPPDVSPAGSRLQPGARLGSRYEILAILGEGGMGAVYKARDLELDRVVALKVIRPEMAAHPHIIERFKREILLASRITHRNVVRIHDLGEAGDLKFISMNFVEGSSLRALLDHEGPLSLEKALGLLRQIAGGLEAAHEAGVVHRDLKPQNVLLDADGSAYIADFGISRTLDHGGTMTEDGALVGTVAYMSPEQARGETPDHRSDLYSLGLILYEMLTGSLPFQSDNALSTLMRRAQENVPSIRTIRSDIPAWLAGIVARCLRRDKADRYPSAADLLRDLDREHASVALGRRRIRRAVSGALLVLALAAVVAGGVSWFRARPAQVVEPQASLVLLPFRNSTGDARYDWTRTGLPDLLRSDLQQSAALRLLGEDRVREVLDGLKLDGANEFDPASVLRISKLLGADSVVTGGLLKAGGQFRLDARVYRVGSSSISRDAPVRVEGKGEVSLFAMVDDLGQKVREELGVSRHWGESRRGANELTTRSVDALRLYSEGVGLAREGGDLDAAKSLEAALAQDPDFAVARALLAETYARLGKSDDAKREADRAVAGLRHASPYEAARIRAIQAQLAGNAEAASKAYLDLCRIAPNDAEALADLASSQEQGGNLAGSRNTFQKVVELDPKNPSARYSLGRVQAKLGNTAEALNELNAALGLHAASGNDQGRADVLNGLGNIYYRSLGKRDEALRYYRDSLAIRERIGDQRGVSVALNNIALVLYDSGKYDDAILTAKRSLHTLEGLGDRAGTAEDYRNLGDIYQGAGKAQEALDAYQKSLDILREIGDEASLAGTFASIGYMKAVLGQYNEAFFFQRSALDKRRQLGEPSDLLRSLIDIGLVEQVQGRYDEALKYYSEGLPLSRKIGDRTATVVLLANLSNIELDQGEFGAALRSLDEARKTAREIGDQNLVATTLAYLGDTRCHLGDASGAVEALDEALEIARKIGSSALEAEILTNRGELLLVGGQPDRAATVLREAVGTAGATRDVRLQLLARIQVGAAGGRTRDLEGVLREAETAGLKPVAVAARLALARSLMAARRPGDALAEAERAVEAAGALRERDLLFQARRLAAEALV